MRLSDKQVQRMQVKLDRDFPEQGLVMPKVIPFDNIIWSIGVEENSQYWFDLIVYDKEIEKIKKYKMKIQKEK